MHSSLFLIVLSIGSISAQNVATTAFTYPNPNGCVAPYRFSSFDACNVVASSLQSCGTINNEQRSRACYCRPEVLSAIFGCENEQILCQGNGNQNSLWEGIASKFHIDCDGYTSFNSFTTPDIIALTSTVDQDVCSTLYSACASGSYLAAQCSSAYGTDLQQFGNCLCATKLQSLNYSCLYLGGLYCTPVGAPSPNISTLFGWGKCKGYESILIPTTIVQPLPASADSQTTSSDSSRVSVTSSDTPSGSPVTFTPTPAPSNTFVPSSTSSTPVTTSRSSGCNITPQLLMAAITVWICLI